MPHEQHRGVKAWAAAAFLLFGRNGITLFGAALTTAGAFLTIGFMLFMLIASPDSPYAGVMAFLVLPPVFIAGLIIIPIGVLWERWRIARHPETKTPSFLPVLDFSNRRVMRAVIIVGVLTFFNILILSSVSYGGLLFMDSVTFCGRVCHSVMNPEFTAYSGSPHARVACVQCHIGPGASWFVKSKLSGARQVFATLFSTYERPIPTPVENLRPSQDTCEQCHWPERFSGDRMRVLTKFDEDEANTKKESVLLMHIGGGGSSSGIHSWHVAPDKKTTYIASDDKRQKMAVVRVRHDDGTVTEFRREGVEIPAGAVERTMDCVDCHNRPTHIYRQPDEEMDSALEAKRIDPTLPFIKKIGMEALNSVEAKDAAADLQKIASQVRGFYEKEHPDVSTSRGEAIQTAIKEMQAMYSKNVFPEMSVSWGAYINNLGHVKFDGCFRCHDDSMKSADGKVIPQDCNACHAVLAMDETDPEILKQLQGG